MTAIGLVVLKTDGPLSTTFRSYERQAEAIVICRLFIGIKKGSIPTIFNKSGLTGHDNIADVSLSCNDGRMRSIATIIPFLLLSGCNEQIDESYSTYSEAQRAQAVERGWIPSFVPSSARDLEDTHNLDTSRQTLRFTIPPSAAADMVSGFRSSSTEDKNAASELIGQYALAATSKVYVVCSEYRNGALAVDAENGRVVFSTTVDWVDDDCE